jgi:hypothetical protein
MYNYPTNTRRFRERFKGSCAPIITLRCDRISKPINAAGPWKGDTPSALNNDPNAGKLPTASCISFHAFQLVGGCSNQITCLVFESVLISPA